MIIDLPQQGAVIANRLLSQLIFTNVLGIKALILTQKLWLSRGELFCRTWWTRTKGNDNQFRFMLPLGRCISIFDLYMYRPWALGKNCHASSMIRTREATSQQLQLNHKYAIFVRNIVMHDFIWGVFRRLDITLFITSCTHSIRVYCWFSVSRHS